MDYISDAFLVSDESDSGLQIDETSNSLKTIEDDVITSNRDELLILPKLCRKFDADNELNGSEADHSIIESVNENGVYGLRIIEACDIAPKEQYKINTSPKDNRKINRIRKILPKIKNKATQKIPNNSNNKIGTRKTNSARRLRSSAKAKSCSPKHTAADDNDYVDSEDIYFDSVPRFHRSVDRLKISQFPLDLVTNAARQVEKLFYGNRLCFICGGLANDAKDLGFHMMKNHSQITKGKWCHVCNQLVSGLFEHLQSHKNDVLMCALCKNSSANFVDLRSHILDHALLFLKPGIRLMPKWFLCIKCPSAFAEELEFNQHKSLH